MYVHNMYYIYVFHFRNERMNLKREHFDKYFYDELILNLLNTDNMIHYVISKLSSGSNKEGRGRENKRGNS